jgi:hypothetical protein
MIVQNGGAWLCKGAGTTTLTRQSCSPAVSGYDGSLRSDGLARDRRDAHDARDAPAGWAAALQATADGTASARYGQFHAVFERHVAMPIDRGCRVPGRQPQERLHNGLVAAGTHGVASFRRQQDGGHRPAGVQRHPIQGRPPAALKRALMRQFSRQI